MSGDAVIKSEKDKKLVAVKGNSANKAKTERLEAARKIFAGGKIA